MICVLSYVVDSKKKHYKKCIVLAKVYLQSADSIFFPCSQEKCKQMQMDASREWARERLMEMENYNQECDRKNDRRKRAEQISLYNIAQAVSFLTDY